MHTNGTYLYDPRFSLVGDSITEFELLEEYGVIQKLQQITYHERYVDYGQKTLENLQIWARPTINWKMEGICSEMPLAEVTKGLE